MAKRCCWGCVYGLRPTSHWLRIILARWPGLLICFNCAEEPGGMHEVYAGGTCRNFQARREPARRREPRQPENADFRYIGLTKGKVAIVDAADYEWLSKHKWSAAEKGDTFYACRRQGKRTIWMHREIMKPPKGMVVDHIDGNGVDNRRSNLRNCTPQQNAYNIKRLCEGSQYAGVFPCGTLWGAKIIHKGQEYWLGLFDTELEAALARDQKALELLGTFAYLNFPHEFEAKLKAKDPRTNSERVCTAHATILSEGKRGQALDLGVERRGRAEGVGLGSHLRYSLLVEPIGKLHLPLPPVPSVLKASQPFSFGRIAFLLDKHISLFYHLHNAALGDMLATDGRSGRRGRGSLGGDNGIGDGGARWRSDAVAVACMGCGRRVTGCGSSWRAGRGC